MQKGKEMKRFSKVAALLMAVLMFGLATCSASAYMFPYSIEYTQSGMSMLTSPLDSSTRSIPVYNNSKLEGSKIGTIYGTDDVTILGFNQASKTLYVKYPIANGKYKYGYVDQKYFSKGDLSGGYSIAVKANGNIQVWAYDNGSRTRGTVFSGDVFYIVYSGKRFARNVQIIYPAACGWKIGFCDFADLEAAKCRAVGSSQTIADGNYKIYLGEDNSMKYAVDADGSYLGNGKYDVHCWEALDIPAQTFEFKHVGNGKYTITCKKNGCVLAASGTSAGATLIARPSKGDDLEKWFVFKTGEGNRYVIFNVATGLAMDTMNYCFENGSDELQWWYNGQSCIIASPSQTVRVSKENLPYLQQNTDPWYGYHYNWKGGSGKNLAESGCGVFALLNAIEAMTARQLTKDDVVIVRNYAEASGDRYNGGTNKSLASHIAAEYGDYFGFYVSDIISDDCNTTSKRQNAISKIDQTLYDGGAVYFSVETSTGGHVVTLVDIRERNGETQYLLVDSYVLDSDNHPGTLTAWCTMDCYMRLYPENTDKVIRIKTYGGFYFLMPK